MVTLGSFSSSHRRRNTEVEPGTVRLPIADALSAPRQHVVEFPAMTVWRRRNVNAVGVLALEALLG
jgi:hypothetical protein